LPMSIFLTPTFLTFILLYCNLRVRGVLVIEFLLPFHRCILYQLNLPFKKLINPGSANSEHEWDDAESSKTKPIDYFKFFAKEKPQPEYNVHHSQSTLIDSLDCSNGLIASLHLHRNRPGYH
jgi:hypothetical protein